MDNPTNPSKEVLFDNSQAPGQVFNPLAECNIDEIVLSMVLKADGTATGSLFYVDNYANGVIASGFPIAGAYFFPDNPAVGFLQLFPDFVPGQNQYNDFNGVTDQNGNNIFAIDALRAWLVNRALRIDKIQVSYQNPYPESDSNWTVSPSVGFSIIRNTANLCSEKKITGLLKRSQTSNNSPDTINHMVLEFESDCDFYLTPLDAIRVNWFYTQFSTTDWTESLPPRTATIALVKLHVKSVHYAGLLPIENLINS